jgi:hypothetical protein
MDLSAVGSGCIETGAESIGSVIFGTDNQSAARAVPSTAGHFDT